MQKLFIWVSTDQADLADLFHPHFYHHKHVCLDIYNFFLSLNCSRIQTVVQRCQRSEEDKSKDGLTRTTVPGSALQRHGETQTGWMSLLNLPPHVHTHTHTHTYTHTHTHTHKENRASDTPEVISKMYQNQTLRKKSFTVFLWLNLLKTFLIGVKTVDNN